MLFSVAKKKNTLENFSPFSVQNFEESLWIILYFVKIKIIKNCKPVMGNVEEWLNWHSHLHTRCNAALLGKSNTDCYENQRSKIFHILSISKTDYIGKSLDYIENSILFLWNISRVFRNFWAFVGQVPEEVNYLNLTFYIPIAIITTI